jgi:uncharacterized protein (TIGR03000 family)
MYSIVVMASLTSAPDVPQFNGYFRDLFHSDANGCNGCNGCCGGARYSCCGGCCGSGYSDYAGSCSGCCGSSCSGGVFGLGVGQRVRSWFERDPSGCYGSRSYSCYGSSCCGSGASYSVSPAYSYAPTLNAGLSCQGGFPTPAPPPTFAPFPPPGAPSAPGIPYATPDAAPAAGGLRQAGQSSVALTGGGAAARAAVLVRLPADARLYADGRPLRLTGTERKFVSPELPTGQEFAYEFKAEYERDGETVSRTKKVAVRPGLTVTVEFGDLSAARPTAPAAGTPTGADRNDKVLTPAAKPVSPEPAVTPEPPIRSAPPAGPGGDRATITVNLPPGATLYVDDRKSPSLEPVRSFTTPPLPAGREFAYLIRAEVLRNGQPETFTQKVPFRAGERVVVDFTSLGK